jgi:hypothetical protein
MSPARTPLTARSIVDDILGRAKTREVWTGNYDKALPVSVQDFDLSAVLPAVLYMFRFGHRRGRGKFVETFGSDADIEHVATKLASLEALEGFGGSTELAILGDMLLCFCLENTKRALGRHEKVQRVAPAHYMASWVDLPASVAHLRYVPEMIAAMLADQKGPYIELNREGDRTYFAVGRGFKDNVLLHAFHHGIVQRGEFVGRTGDRFEEQTSVGLDQLLMIRLAQQLGEAPDKLRGREGERISNQRPVAERAARHFSEDIRRFVRAYAGVIPRHAFIELLESCMAVGLTTIATSVIELLFAWTATGTIRNQSEQKPTVLFVDCSNGIDRRLRALAEQSMDDFMRRIEWFPVVMMVLRLLDHGARYDSKLRELKIETRPYATDWLDLLGELLHERRAEGRPILYDLERRAAELGERLQEDYPDAAETLRNDRGQPSPVWRLAEVLTSLQGRKSTQNNVVALLDSAFLLGRPNGLAAKRAVIRKAAVGGPGKRRDLRSLVFTDSVLDYLVHLHVLRTGNKKGVRPLSFKEFLQALHERYGFCVDSAPPGMTISNELLRLNRAVLERRLRDLGLLRGVNDAEAMKQLRSRFERAERYNHVLE